MKIKIINKDKILPNCWKSCGVDKDAWDKLQEGKVIEVKQIANGVKGNVEIVTETPKAKPKKEIK